MKEMSVSFKKNEKKTNIKHNNRDFKEEEWNLPKNEHINRELGHQNIVIVQKDIREVYDEEFKEALDEYNVGKRKDRQITDYYKHIKKSGSHREEYEFIVGFGSKKDWDKLPFYAKQEAGEWLAAYARDFMERHPNLIVYNAVVHLDEAGEPHLHLNIVPVATGYKKGLKKQVSLSKALANEGYPGRDRNNRDQWNLFRKTEVAALTRFLKEMGYERKLVGTNNIKDMREFKEMIAEAKQEVGRFKKQKQEELKNLDNRIEHKKENVKQLTERIDKLEDLKDRMFSEAQKQDELIKQKNKEINTLKEKVKLQEHILNDVSLVDRIKKTFSGNEADRVQKLARELTGARTAELFQRTTEAENKVKEAEKKVNSLFGQNKELKQENQQLKIENQELKNENGLLSKSLKVLQRAFDYAEKFLKSLSSWKVFKQSHFKNQDEELYKEFQTIRHDPALHGRPSQPREEDFAHIFQYFIDQGHSIDEALDLTHKRMEELNKNVPQQKENHLERSNHDMER